MPRQRKTPRAEKRGQGELESEVLAEIWAQGCPVTAADIVEALGGDLAHNTIQTTLVRLFDKGLVQREKVGRAHAYRAARDEVTLTAERMAAHLGPSSDRRAVLAQFVATLDPADSEALRLVFAADGNPGNQR